MIRFLDRPYENQPGSIKPGAMTTTPNLMTSDLSAIDPAGCDRGRRPRSGALHRNKSRHPVSYSRSLGEHVTGVGPPLVDRLGGGAM
jgi:hypothetical protein